MEFTFKGIPYPSETIEVILKEVAGHAYIPEMFTVFSKGLNNPDLLPKLKEKKSEITDLKQYANKWVGKYLSGYNNRPSVRQGNASGTIPDSLVSLIYRDHKGISKEEAQAAASAHSVMMVIENIVGDLLEEFLAIHLKEYDWFCCWGSTIKAVDFCHKEGALLQVKTSDNSENSSSSNIRTGTEIQKWARRKSRRKDEYYWKDLQLLTGHQELNEECFRYFVRETLENNPKCIYMEQTTE